MAAHQGGHLDEAERLYRAVAQQDATQADAMALLGVVLGTMGKFDEALAWVEKAVALDPGAALFHFQRGSILATAQKCNEAISAFRRALALKPDFAEAQYNLANLLRASNDWAGAIAAYRAAIERRPAYAEAYNNLALSLAHEKDYDGALLEAKKAVQIAPGYGEGWRTLCNIAEQVKNYDLALEAGQRCVQLMPDSHFAWFGYGVALNRVDRNEEAVAVYKRALELKPDRSDIWDNLGQTYQSMGRLEEAEQAYRKAIETAGQVIADEDSREVREEEYGSRHWHLALLELLRGKLKPGFARYRSRFLDVGGLHRPNLSRPLWRGEDLTGKTLLVTDEQGFGDTLHFCRYLPLLKAKGVRIIFSVHPVLEPFFRDWGGKDVLITHGMPVPAYDFYASIFDLPHRLGTTLETIPAAVPYLPVLPPDDATRLPDDGRRRVGVVWGGSPAHKNDARRSVPLECFASLFNETAFHFFSLNRDMKPGDAERLPGLPVTDLAPRLHNFADNARFIAQMDLLITCDTATAHLAGGMGIPVWVLLPFAPDWRWLTGRDDSPWYPRTRLFRQAAVGDWADVVRRVRAALGEWE